MPRLINIACDKALILAYGAGRRRVNRGLAEAALVEQAIFERSTVNRVASRSDRRDVRSRFRQQPVERRLARIAAAVLLTLIGTAALVLTIPRTAELLKVHSPAGDPAAPAKIVTDPTPAPKPLSALPVAVPDGSEASLPAAPVQPAMGAVSSRQPLLPPGTTSSPTPVPSATMEITIPPPPERPVVPLVIPGSKEATIRHGDATPGR